IGKEAKDAVPSLTAAIKDPHPDVGNNAAVALWQIDPQNTVAIPHLLEVLSSKDRVARAGAAQALGRIGPAAQVAVPALTGALKDAEPHVRLCAATALWHVNADAKATVPILVDLLEKTGTGQGVGFLAPDALAKMGPAAKQAVPALVAALKSEDQMVRKSA